MATSEARILANQQNAQLSTGPKTAEGKDRSRANALKHGLTATVLVPEDLQAVQDRSNEWYYCLKPQNPHQAWIVSQVSIMSLRIDRGERIERRLRDRAMLRAELTWDDDRKIEVEDLAARLTRKPSEIVRKLRATPQGCDWLIARWSQLARLAATLDTWNVDQNTLAFDLLGANPETREASRPGDIVNIDGVVVEPSPGPLAVARREIADLQERRDIVADLDEVDRALVSADQYDEPNRELKNLRRYESQLHTRLRWFLALMHDPSPYTRTHLDLKPNWVERIEPDANAPAEPPPRIDLHPPFDLEPHEYPEPGQNADIPKIRAARLEKKIRQAEARRDVRRRRVERLRA